MLDLIANLFLIKNTLGSDGKTYEKVMCWGLTSDEERWVREQIEEITERYDPRWKPSHRDYWHIKRDPERPRFIARRIHWLPGSEITEPSLVYLLGRIERDYREGKIF